MTAIGQTTLDSFDLLPFLVQRDNIIIISWIHNIPNVLRLLPNNNLDFTVHVIENFAYIMIDVAHKDANIMYRTNEKIHFWLTIVEITKVN